MSASESEDTVDTFSGLSEDKNSEEDYIIVPGEAGAYEGKPLEDGQENQGEEERDADGLTAEMLEARSERRSPVK